MHAGFLLEKPEGKRWFERLRKEYEYIKINFK
jgi:hypothetical protein